jgi:YebC/PmpR family DNA-binding regulatory protein
MDNNTTKSDGFTWKINLKSNMVCQFILKLVLFFKKIYKNFRRMAMRLYKINFINLGRIAYVSTVFMSGHSKWATTHRKKEVADARRSAVFTKLSNNITFAARQGGGEIDSNFKLRLAVDKAKEANMPKDNIERAIKKGTGELEGATIEEITYEGFGPVKSAFIVEVVTDNKNRIVAELKHIFSKHGGSLGATGSVSWQFERKGVVSISSEDYQVKKGEIELDLIEAGAQDIKEHEDYVEIFTKIEDLQKVKEVADKFGLSTKSAGLEWVPKEEIGISGDEDRKRVEDFMEALDDNSDVQDFYTNISI